MTLEQSLKIAGCWIEYDPEFPDLAQWRQCIHAALTERPKETFDRDHILAARQMYKHALFEVFKRRNTWFVQLHRGIAPFRSKKSAQKFADANKAIEPAL